MASISQPIIIILLKIYLIKKGLRQHNLFVYIRIIKSCWTSFIYIYHHFSRIEKENKNLNFESSEAYYFEWLINVTLELDL